jgi:hypothetical protein
LTDVIIVVVFLKLNLNWFLVEFDNALGLPFVVERHEGDPRPFSHRGISGIFLLFSQLFLFL